ARLDTRFCSPVCARHGRENAIVHPDRPCEQCGTTFKPVSDRARFCSNRCAGIAKRDPPPPPRKCATCGAEFTVPRKSSTKKFCGRSCAGKAAHAVTKPPDPA